MLLLVVSHSSIKSLTARYSAISVKSGVLLKACQDIGSFCSKRIAPTRGSNMKFVFGSRCLKVKVVNLVSMLHPISILLYSGIKAKTINSSGFCSDLLLTHGTL